MRADENTPARRTEGKEQSVQKHLRELCDDPARPRRGDVGEIPVYWETFIDGIKSSRSFVNKSLGVKGFKINA